MRIPELIELEVKKMSVEKRIALEIKRRGMTIRAVSNMSGVPYSKLQPSLQERRELRAEEFLSICQILDMDPMAIAKKTDEGGVA